MYAVRHDEQRAPADVQQEVRNLAREATRLHAVINSLYDREMKLLADQLRLAEINMPASLEATDYSFAMESAADLDALESHRFMRTESTQTLSDKPPHAKWHGMLRMFSHWRGETALAQAQEATQQPLEKNTAEDIAAIRAALHHLRYVLISKGLGGSMVGVGLNSRMTNATSTDVQG